ncbi:conjugation system TraG family ATPase [Chitinophaga niastensis]|uniref:Conjugation system TraG family ATPase n=1 Tax=Chitinophaga niastensis TaxID=536980 RepID=A0A2P8H9B5_CHINA|nr:TraG family conjugative transposon ATPase [Chitinophaga niastensis]PSL42823.1 conjugation system TraG family ATPase [Chitinophaga niastensis]
MKQIKKLENVLPIFKVEDDFIISKSGDITIAFSVTLPEIFTLSINDYEAVHQAFLKAIRVLPDFTVLHKQDWFIESKFKPDFTDTEQSFLTRSSNRHFNERPFLDHECYIYLTKIANPSKEATPLTSILIKNSIVPSKMIDDKEIQLFEDKVGQFARILQDSTYFALQRLKNDELISSENKVGLIERYCFLLGRGELPYLADIKTGSDLAIGNRQLQIFALSDAEDLPSLCGPRVNLDKYSTDRTKFSIGFAAPLGLLLSCNHIYNQYLIIGNAHDAIKKLESKRLRLQSLSTYSRENTIARDATNAFLNEAISKGRLPIQAHFNIVAWDDDPAKARDIKNIVSSAIAGIDANTKIETASAPQLFWAAFPGNAAEIPNTARFDTFAEQASCFFNIETNYRTSVSSTGLRLGDRISGLPLNVDIFEEPIAKNIIQNRNIFLCGPSGSGKSFATNHLLRSCWEQGAHVVIVDVGHSYKGLCSLAEGYYFTYAEDNPIAFNPFYIPDNILDTEKKESIKTLLLALWKKDDETYSRSEYISLSNALQNYFDFLKSDTGLFPCFNSFYEYLRDIFLPDLRQQGVKDRDFDVDNFLYVLKPYYKNGEYSYLLNATTQLDLLDQRMIVFELDKIKDHPIIFAVTTLTICEIFISKMRRLKGVRKIILIEEAWKAIARQGMAEYIKYLFKTVRKFWGTAIVVTQEVDDIISSSIIKDAIVNNSDIKILLDQSKYANKFQAIQDLLGLSDKDRTLILSMNKANDPAMKYKEIFISLGGSVSKVYRTEVSLEEYLAYSTEEKEKVLLQQYAKKFGSIKRGIAMLASDIRQNKL